MELKIATRQCRDQQGINRRFHYFLTIDLEETPSFVCENYGVRIAEEEAGERALRGITTSASRNDELLTLLVDNAVGPVGLEDTVADWL